MTSWTTRTVVGIAILAVAITWIVALTPAPSEAWGRVFIGVGPYWGWGYPGPYYYGYPSPPYHPPVAVVQQPQVYIEQPAAVAQPPAVSSEAPPAPESAYWYYCPSSRDYYPNVPSCSEAWVRVPARTQ